MVSVLPPAAVFFPSAQEGWLDWAVGLTRLQELRLKAATMRLQPEEGLRCLLPLRHSLQALRLDGCVLLTDAGAPTLAQLRCVCCPGLAAAVDVWPSERLGASAPQPAAPSPNPHTRSRLSRLEVTCCQAGQAGVDALASLPCLAHLELYLRDEVAIDRLVHGTAVGAGGSLVVHAWRAKANGLVGAAGARMPALRRLAVDHMGCDFVLTAAPTFDLLSRLTSLRWVAWAWPTCCVGGATVRRPRLGCPLPSPCP